VPVVHRGPLNTVTVPFVFEGNAAIDVGAAQHRTPFPVRTIVLEGTGEATATLVVAGLSGLVRGGLGVSMPALSVGGLGGAFFGALGTSAANAVAVALGGARRAG
jgi:hypothetical protein